MKLSVAVVIATPTMAIATTVVVIVVVVIKRRTSTVAIYRSNRYGNLLITIWSSNDCSVALIDSSWNTIWIRGISSPISDWGTIASSITEEEANSRSKREPP